MDDLFADPIIEQGATNTILLTTELFDSAPDAVITVGFKPGVTDNPGKAATDGFQTLFPRTAALDRYLSHLCVLRPSIRMRRRLAGRHPSQQSHRASPHRQPRGLSGESMARNRLPDASEQIFIAPQSIDLEVDDDALETISNEGLLALNLNEMHAIQSPLSRRYIRQQRTSMGISPDAPTDVELECLAQTWVNIANTRSSLQKFITSTMKRGRTRWIPIQNAHHETHP